MHVNLARVTSHDEADRIADVIANFRCIGHLQLTNYSDDWNDRRRASAPAVDAILRGMCRSQSSVTGLTLMYSWGGRSAIVEFAKRFPDLRRLTLEGGGFDDLVKVTNDFSRGLSEAIGQWQRLAHVSYHARGEDRDVARIMKALRDRPHLAEMVVWSDRLQPQLPTDVCKVGAASPSLRELAFDVFREDGDFGNLDRAFFSFPRPLSPNLESVKLQGFSFPPRGSLLHPPRALENVTTLKLGACNFVDGAESLLYVLDTMRQLMELHVHKYDEAASLSNEDILAFARWVPSRPFLNCVTIYVGPGQSETGALAMETLLRNCRGALDLTCSHLRAGDAVHLCRGLESVHAHLKSLTLRLGLRAFGESELLRVLQIVGSNQTLEQLSMTVSVDASEELLAPALLAMLRTNRTLQGLTFDNAPSELLTEVYDGITAGLAENDSIRRVSVTSSWDGSRVVPVSCLPGLVRALRTNGTIRELEGLPFPSAVEHPLTVEAAFLLKQNRFGRSLILKDPPESIGLWARIFANISRAGASDVMYRFLKTRSELLGRRRGITRTRVE